MEKLKKFLSSAKNIITWTICYGVFLWVVLYFLFDFNILLHSNWHYILHARFHGFIGILFCILILVAVPIYIATITLIVRQNKPFLEIGFPNIKLSKIFYNPITPAPENKAVDEPTETKDTKESDLSQRSDVPREMRANFVRGMRNLELVRVAKTNVQSADTEPKQSFSEPEIMPLPSDFDVSFDDVPGYDDGLISTPVFTDINFSDDADGAGDIDVSFDSNDFQFENKMTQYLYDIGKAYNVVDDIIVTDKHAIISHTDTDFWVTDNENWFATGKTRPSPIDKIKSFASEHNLSPVIYLGEQNIMDIETLVPQWESDGIIVITEPDDLVV